MEFYPDDGFKTGYPWIFYERSAEEILYVNKRVKFRASFNEDNELFGIQNELHFKLAKYDLEGTFYGYEDLSNQLTICDKSPEEIANLRKIGKTTKIQCDFDVSRLVSTNKFDHFRNENFFYELFLVDYNGDLIDIPVQITNIQGTAGDRSN